MNPPEIESSRLLLVEDDPNDVELIRLALETGGLAAPMDVVNDGEAALNYLLGEALDNSLDDASQSAAARPLPRFVLLDLKLPRINGIQLLQRLRSHPRTRRLVIVVMSSSQEDPDLNACYDLGVNSYIVKPQDFQQFSDAVQQISHYWMQLNYPPLPTPLPS
ncbi:response regulator [Thermoleptolyngbya sichuanensis XZ-Cy5]|uniref:response regulator n=1 Tax=Thermoleptolyngbya TaxID=2303528 RepID=UPI0019E9D211|nr:MULTISPECIES: response regulator [Thermoleptolyngbya]MDG2616338.1 response regulator [Thermoleptolyngbya sichuanensis XZ-Cy5]HIK41996.1 response regulator [Thermoleptolyngbya sp. M55_K2018_002]